MSKRGYERARNFIDSNLSVVRSLGQSYWNGILLSSRTLPRANACSVQVNSHLSSCDSLRATFHLNLELDLNFGDGPSIGWTGRAYGCKRARVE